MYLVEKTRLNGYPCYELITSDETVTGEILWQGDNKDFGEYITKVKQLEEAINELSDELGHPFIYQFRNHLLRAWDGLVPEWNWVIVRLADYIEYCQDRGYSPATPKAVEWAKAIHLANIDWEGCGLFDKRSGFYEAYCKLFPLVLV